MYVCGHSYGRSGGSFVSQQLFPCSGYDLKCLITAWGLVLIGMEEHGQLLVCLVHLVPRREEGREEGGRRGNKGWRREGGGEGGGREEGREEGGRRGGRVQRLVSLHSSLSAFFKTSLCRFVCNFI